MQVNCSKCSRAIAVADVIESSAGRLSHLDCARAKGLTPEERALLVLFCSDHLVATCLACSLEFHRTEMSADPLGGRTHLCPRCRTDLTESVRGHLFSCGGLPGEIRQKAQAVRDAAQHLIKQAREAIDRSDVLIRQAEAHLFKSQQALRAAMTRRAR